MAQSRTQVSKRDIPHWLRKLLAQDQRVTKACFERFDSQYGLASHRHWLKYLEISCHGIPWIFGTCALLYILPDYLQIWVNLLYLLFLDIALVAITKAFTRRRRPAYNQMDMFATVSVDKFSFPSGHSTRAVALAFFFTTLFPLPFVLVPFVYLWALSVCVSRVLLGRHHILDVIGGIGIGFANYLVLASTLIDEERSKWIGLQLFGEDPWSSG